jgi:hypothetical protein
MKLKPVFLEITEELIAALDLARGDEPRNAFIERTLWNSAAVKSAAKSAGIKKPVRRKPGRPRKDQ